MKKNLTYILTACASLVSCSGILDENPGSYYEHEEFFKDAQTAAMGITGIYNVLPLHYGDYEMAMAASDDTYYVSGVNQDNGRRDIAHYQLTTTNTYVENDWRYTYDGLNRANYMIVSTWSDTGAMFRTRQNIPAVMNRHTDREWTGKRFMTGSLPISKMRRSCHGQTELHLRKRRLKVL